MRLSVGLAFFAVCTIWGSTYFAILIGLESVPPFFFAGARFLIAGGLMYAVLRARGVAAPTREQWKNAALIGFMLCAAGNGLVTFSEQWVSSSLAAIIVATIPLWAAVFAAIGGKSPSRYEWVALATGFAGVAFLNLGGEIKAAGWLGAGAILLAPIAWAYGSVKSREVSLPQGMMSSAAQMLAGGTVLMFAGLASGEKIPEEISLRSALALGYLVVFGSIIGFSAYGYLLRVTRPAIATAYAYVNPLVAMVLGATLAGEKLERSTIIAAFGIVASVVLLAVAKSRTTAPAKPPIAKLSYGSAAPR